MLVIRVLEELHLHVHQWKGLPEAVGHQYLLLLENLCDHQKIIEEEDLPLVQTHPLGAVGIWDLIELAAANKTAMWKRKNWLFSNYHSLHSLHLRYMIIICPQFPTLDSLVYSNKQIPGNILPVIHPTQVFNEVI